MDRTVLLVLLSLQVFLLITSFTSTDAAALITDDQPQQYLDLVERMSVRRENKRQKQRFFNCSLRPGGCSVMGQGGHVEENAGDKQVERMSELRENKRQKQRFFNCSLRPGGCSVMALVRLNGHPVEKNTGDTKIASTAIPPAF